NPKVIGSNPVPATTNIAVPGKTGKPLFLFTDKKRRSGQKVLRTKLKPVTAVIAVMAAFRVAAPVTPSILKLGSKWMG
ncbi:MAG: hypothetical protein RR757_05740, partial [Raoultibacter sp.]